MQGPYIGLKVIELGRFIAAPYCGQLLADGGADVIKVEPLVGDDARRNGTRFSPTEARQYLNKNRASAALHCSFQIPASRGSWQGLLAKAMSPSSTSARAKVRNWARLRNGFPHQPPYRLRPEHRFRPRGSIGRQARHGYSPAAYTGMTPMTAAAPDPRRSVRRLHGGAVDGLGNRHRAVQPGTKGVDRSSTYRFSRPRS